MEMEDHDEDQEEEQVSTIQNAAGPFKTATSQPLIPLSLSLPAEKKPPAMSSSSDRYTECLKNHAASIGGHALDGCGEFMPAGPKGTLEALTCAACNCHRNFHRKEVVDYPTAGQQQQIRPISCYKPHPVLFRFYPCEDGTTSFERKRVRTKFTAEQKERMRQVAEKVGWRLQKKDEAAVQRFCQETGIKRHVFKVWMHNHKHTFANKLPLA